MMPSRRRRDAALHRYHPPAFPKRWSYWSATKLGLILGVGLALWNWLSGRVPYPDALRTEEEPLLGSCSGAGPSWACATF